MKSSSMTITAKFEGCEISVVSSDPLIGALALTSNMGVTIEVNLDRYCAETLLSALVQFLAHVDDGAQSSW